MRERFDSHHQLAEELRTTIPPVPGGESLSRMRAKTARAVRRAERRAPRTRAWRLVGTAAAAVALAVGVFAVSPALENRAFAREQAADALLLHVQTGEALHIVQRYTETSWTEKGGHDSRDDVDQTWQTWVDPVGERAREEFTNNSDGSLDNLRVRNGDRMMMFQNNVRSRTGAKPQFLDERNIQAPLQTAVGASVDYIRARIADGTAKPTGSTSIDGEEYWIVEWTQDGDLGIDDRIHVTVTMRKSDYRLKTWVQEVTYTNGDGKGVQKERYDVKTIETVSLDSLPAGTFDFESVTKLVPEEVKAGGR